jgi:predicted amino acid-binding ACT domain protein
MGVAVKQITLWRSEVANRPGALAGMLGPLAQAGGNLKVVMGYRMPGEENRAAIEVYPVTGRKVTAAARSVGLSDSGIPTLLVDGDDRPGLGAAIARGVAEAGINMIFLMAQVVGRRYSAIIGLESAADARKAAAVVKKAKPAKKH